MFGKKLNPVVYNCRQAPQQITAVNANSIDNLVLYVFLFYRNINFREEIFIKPSENVDQVQINLDEISMITKNSAYGTVPCSRNHS